MLKHTHTLWLALIACVAITLGNIYWGWSLLWFLPVVIVWIGLTSWGVFDIRLGYFSKTWYKGDATQNYVSITFDDGPTPFTPKILELLEQHQMKATFFCIGKQMEKHPEILTSIIEKGHTVGNHSYSHVWNIPFFSPPKIEQEINHTDEILAQLTGTKTNLYRPPYGITNPNVVKACINCKKLIIGWSVRSLDTVIHQEEKILQRIIPRVKPGAIILLHDTSEHTINVVEQLLLSLKRMNLQSIPVDHLLKREYNA